MEMQSKRINPRFRKSRDKLIALLIGVFLSIVILLLTEGVFYIMNAKKTLHWNIQREGNYTDPGFYFADDELLGYKPPHDMQITSRLITNGKTVYDVIYSIDHFSRRETPIHHRTSNTKFILFFGGSYAFGEGVKDNETLPYYLSEYASELVPYNYAFHGYGPQNMLAKLQSADFEKEIQERQGILIYVFMHHHISRAIGDKNVTTGWGRHLPYYTLTNNGMLEKKGNLTSGRPLLSFLYRQLSKSNILKYYHINFPPRIKSRHIGLTARIIEEAQTAFREKFNGSDFYVLLFPEKEFRAQYSKKLMTYLKDAGIKYFDYTELIDITQEGWTIVGDGHPTAKTYRVVAEKLAQDLMAMKKNGNATE
jgi:hypothetical protein